MKLLGFGILLAFYSLYLGKMLLLKRKGIQVNQIAKRRQKDRVFYVELVMRIATFAVLAAEIASIVLVQPSLPLPVLLLGAGLGLLGLAFFGAAIVTMRDSWRAGLAEEDKTEFVSSGVYKISRNPAFVGFDCVYLGLLLLFFNWPLLLLTAFAMLMLHLQILQEEQYLPTVFGQVYLEYKSTVCRYLGRRRA